MNATGSASSPGWNGMEVPFGLVFPKGHSVARSKCASNCKLQREGWGAARATSASALSSPLLCLNNCAVPSLLLSLSHWLWRA